MLETAIILGSFIFFTALVGFVTWLLTRKDDHGSSAGYFLAGRSLTGGYIAGSLMLTNLSTEQLVGLNGAAFRDGICVMAWEVLAGASLVIMALYFLPRYLKSGIATVPEFLEERFGDSTRAITSLIFIVAYAGILLPIILYTGATGLTGILDVKGILGLESADVAGNAPADGMGTADYAILWGAVWLIGIIGSLYAIFGGLRTVAVSDTLNGFGLLVGGFLILFFGLNAINSESIFGAVKELYVANPEKFNSLGGADSSVPVSTLFTGVLLLNLFYWCTNQQIIQRTFGASSLKEGQKGVLLAGVLKILAPLILVIPGLIAFHLYGDTIANDKAYGTLVSNVLPTWLAGFFAAVMVGAILSSFNSALNSTATLFSLGVYKQMLHPTASDERVIHSGKVFGTILAIVSMTIAPLLAGQDSIFGYLQKMNGLYFIPIFSVVLVGMLSKRAPRIAADAALIVGFISIAAFYFVIQPMTKGAAVDLNQPFYDFHFLGLMFVLLVGFQLVMAQVAPRDTPYEQRDAGAVDMTSWPLAKPLGVGLIVVVFGIYAFFASVNAIFPVTPAESAEASATQVDQPLNNIHPRGLGSDDLAGRLGLSPLFFGRAAQVQKSILPTFAKLRAVHVPTERSSLRDTLSSACGHDASGFSPYPLAVRAHRQYGRSPSLPTHAVPGRRDALQRAFRVRYEPAECSPVAPSDDQGLHCDRLARCQCLLVPDRWNGLFFDDDDG